MTLSPVFWTYLKVVLLVATVPAIVGFVIVLAERRSPTRAASAATCAASGA